MFCIENPKILYWNLNKNVQNQIEWKYLYYKCCECVREREREGGGENI